MHRSPDESSGAPLLMHRILAPVKAAWAGRLGGPVWWFLLSGFFALVSMYTLAGGHMYPGLHLPKMCELAGHPIDREYRMTVNTDRIFPVTKPCTEDFNLVAWWINPLIVFTALASIATLTLFVRTTELILAKKREPRNEENYG